MNASKMPMALLPPPTHAIAHVLAVAKQFPTDAVIVVNLSGRGDKDVNSVQQILEESGAMPREETGSETRVQTGPKTPEGVK